MATKRSIKRRPINDDSTEDSAEGEQPLIMTLNDVRLRHSHVIPHLIQDFCTMSDKSSASIEQASYPIDDRSKSETADHQHASKSELKHLERVLLSDQELLQLQQLIAYHNHQSEQHVNETEKNISNTNRINNENNEQNSMVDQRCESKNQANNNKKKQSSGGGTRRPHMENDIDPMWYLVNGPLIIFPPEQLSRLTMNDMVDYYRAYPTMNWSKYPRLYEQIVQNLTERERSDLQLMDEQYRRQNQLKRKIYRFYVRYLRHFDFYKLVKWLFTFITSVWR